MQTILTGAFKPRLLIEQFVRDEYQFEVSGANKRLLIVFYKGTWNVQDVANRFSIEIDDSPEVLEDDAHPLWLGFCLEKYRFYSASWNGKPYATVERNPGREWPGKIIADLTEMHLGEITQIHVVQAERNGIIRDGVIKAY